MNLATRLRDLSILKKLLLAILAVSGLVLTLVATLFLAYDLYKTRLDMEEKYSTQAKMLAYGLAPALAFQDKATARTTLATLSLEPHVLHATVHTPEGALFASYVPQGSHGVALALKAEMEEAQPGVADCPPVEIRHDHLHVCMPILLEDETLGTLVLGVSMAPLHQRLGFDLLAFSAALAAAMLLAYLVARLLTRLVAQPILQLTHAVARVSANKDYSLRCEKHGGDELGVLTDGFNEMLAQIEQQDRRLKEYSAELERRVSERTRDLEQTIAALQTAKMAAETASRAKTEFLSSMSHELRTPLNAIIGFAQLLEFDQKLDEEQVDSVREIYKAGQHLLALINEVLDLARIESGRMEMNMEPVALGGLVDECVTLVQSAAAKETVSLHRDLSPCTGHLVWADRLRLKQVLLNLLSNAIKYNRRGGHVDITCHRDAPGRIRLAVSDTGLGIPMDQQAKLFTPFNRLGQEGEAIEGTGIGLVICKRVLEMMGGSIGFTSQPGHGTTFWFELGEADAASQAAEGQGK